VERSRKSWGRGAIVLGLAGTMMAAALMSPALAVRLATTGYVKSQVRKLAIEDGIFYARTDPQLVQPATAVIISIPCPPEGVAISGGASTGNIQVDNVEVEISYPSSGATTNAGSTGWTVSVQNDGSAAINVRGYVICAHSSAINVYGENVAPRVSPIG
jgi:hypothetical protein